MLPRTTVPEATLRRLPAYYHLLSELCAGGIQWVSCSLIGHELRLDPTQVRKDIECTGIVGKPRVGYSVAALSGWIEQFLGWNNAKDAFLVGIGSLGTALLGYERFRQFGLNIVAAFDDDPAKIGTWIHDKEILPVGYLPDLARRMRVRLGVIAVPAGSAQRVADLMVNSGIRALWNFAPMHVRAPESVIVQNEDLYHSLASLSFKLEQRLKLESETAPAQG
jgi:redox-sensing transcriptional repressor